MQDMTDYKMIYQDQVFNVLNVTPEFDYSDENPDTRYRKPKYIHALYIDENGEIRAVKDEAWCFKFVRR